MARLHVQTRTAGQCDSHCRVIDSHDLHHADDTNHAGYQQLTIKNIKHLKEKREMMIKLVNPDCDAATTCRIYELQDGEIILNIEYETINPQPPDETLCGAHRNRRRRPGNLLVFSEYEREDPREVRGSI